ncbi:uncharacterized protein LOC122861145 [Aphidius gifuensis]|uniref:uncharacterized protein LOC122861145 n=1 Tax=Aphidius gifuensis TaxID=684658 RepID=UPI001CDD28F1|nr:uncharacterized protein LOC122861145 [Aphidius gifuensis]
MEEQKQSPGMKLDFAIFEIGCDLITINDADNEIVQSSIDKIKNVTILALMKEGYAVVDFTIPIEPVSIKCLLDVAEISLLKKSQVFKINNNSFLKIDYVIQNCVIREKGLDLASLIEMTNLNPIDNTNDTTSTTSDDNQIKNDSDDVVFCVDSTDSSDSDDNLVIDCLDSYDKSSSTKPKVIKYLYNPKTSSYFSFNFM